MTIDEVAAAPPPARTIALHKPRGVITTRRDPEGRPTVYQLIAGAGAGLAPVGRLDRASTGLLLCTTDTRLSAWLTAPGKASSASTRSRCAAGSSPPTPRAWSAASTSTVSVTRGVPVRVRKASGRESHLMVVLTEGKNREIRRLCAAIGHEVTRLHRVRIGGLTLDTLAPGAWRIIPEEILGRAFPGYSGRRSCPPDRIAGGSPAPDA